MKKLVTAVFMAVMLVSGISLAQEKAKAVQSVDTVVMDVTLNNAAQSVTLKVDGDYTWDTLVTKKGLQKGDEGFETARAYALALEKAWNLYDSAREDGRFEDAVAVAPRSDVKGWMSLRCGRETIGTWSSQEERYVYDPESSVEKLQAAKDKVKLAEKYAQTAKDHKVGPATGDNSVKNLSKEIDNFKTAISSIEKYQADQAAKQAKKKAKAAK